MNVTIRGTHATVTLSRRNLLSLLAKLNKHPRNTACTLARICENNHSLTVTAVDDDQEYINRKPGPMHPETEAEIRKAR